MLKLFKNVFLETQRHFHTKYQHLVLSKHTINHPLSIILREEVGKVDSFESYLNDKHKGSEEDFWKFLVNIPEDDVFVVFAEDEMFQHLLFTFWKNIFTDLSLDSLYELYNCFQIESSVSNVLTIDRADNPFGNSSKHFPSLSKEQLKKRYEEASTISYLRKLDKEILSFEYLLAEALGDPQSIYLPTFLNVLKEESWAAWFADLEEIKSQIVMCFHDIHKIFPELESWESRFTGPEEMIQSHPSLSWMLDESFHSKNIAYVLKNFAPEVFSDLQRRCDEACFVFFLNGKTKLDTTEIYNLASKGQDLFDQNYFKILQDDIERGYGCKFIARLRPYRLGGYFAQRLYRYKLHNNEMKLKEFNLI